MAEMQESAASPGDPHSKRRELTAGHSRLTACAQACAFPHPQVHPVNK